jgi:rubrerythrin
VTASPITIATVEEFYAHALAIEHEAAERYAEFRRYFADRGEDVLAGLCANLAAAEREHFDELMRGCENLNLPAIPAESHRWLPDAPEAPAHEVMCHVATACQLLEIALAAEVRAHDFFVGIARTAPTRGVRELASIMAAEEVEHVSWVRQALEYHGAGDAEAPPREPAREARDASPRGPRR